MSDATLGRLATERPNPRSENLDELSGREIARLMNAEDRAVAEAVERALPQIGEAIERLAEAIAAGGHCLYVGAGTSGRLAALDAAECPPTFGVGPEVFQVIMAGGADAFVHAAEGAEDDAEAGARDLAARGPGAHDVVVGIAASGRTPYVLGAVGEAKRRGLKTIGIACNLGTPLGEAVDLAIEVEVGPEVLLGSTRLKAGTAQKMVLNMLSTGAMVRTGRAYRNLMVDMKPTNEKLRQRAVRMTALATGVTDEVAREALASANWQVKVAIVMLTLGVSREEAEARLAAARGFVRQACQGKVGDA